jgi:type I restriction enzyme R subunit
MIPMAHQIVGDYLVIDEAREEENRRHMLMRPYQVHALQAVEGAAFGWDNDEKLPHGGFVWHTTGSGKTITSFKTALFLSTRAGFDKVIFLVDRRELDNRTSENFKAYAASKRLNTLYVDRSLELQALIQAYSRTNRIFGFTKEFGTIINFQYPRITEETVNEALRLYSSGGKSSKAIFDTYVTAVQKLEIKVAELLPTLPNPTDWQTIKDDEVAKEAFILAFEDAAEQLNLVQQYYEYKWNDGSFGIDEHTWLQYVGAYKNLTWQPGSPSPPTPVNTLVGKTKLAGTQVIDANHILSLIGSKVTSPNGVQTVDKETLRIIYEQIQELSNMGEHEQAQLLKEFVDNELVPGNLSSALNFDEAFEIWKASKLQNVVNDFSLGWGLDSSYLKGQ